MNVLIVIDNNPKKRFLVRLHTPDLIDEVKGLISERKHSEAIMSMLCKGKLEREISHQELPSVKANLIISGSTARWDLT